MDIIHNARPSEKETPAGGRMNQFLISLLILYGQVFPD